jgi:hypothetical protein
MSLGSPETKHSIVTPHSCCCTAAAATAAPQVAGIRYLHKDGAFVSAMLLNADGTSSAIDPKMSYTIVATDYMLQVGSHMMMCFERTMRHIEGHTARASVCTE